MTDDLRDEVTTHVVLEWAMKQARHLTPTQHHVLLYLTINAWRYEPNAEDVPAGSVLRGRNSMASIALYTGISESTVRRTLRSLQEACYVHQTYVPGRGSSAVRVFWSEKADQLRQDIRDGVKKRPKEFDLPTSKKRSLKVVQSDNVLQFPASSQ